MNLLLCTLLVLLWPPGLSHDEHSHPEEKDVKPWDGKFVEAHGTHDCRVGDAVVGLGDEWFGGENGTVKEIYHNKLNGRPMIKVQMAQEDLGLTTGYETEWKRVGSFGQDLERRCVADGTCAEGAQLEPKKFDPPWGKAKVGGEYNFSVDDRVIGIHAGWFIEGKLGQVKKTWMHEGQRYFFVEYEDGTGGTTTAEKEWALYEDENKDASYTSQWKNDENKDAGKEEVTTATSSEDGAEEEHEDDEDEDEDEDEEDGQEDGDDEEDDNRNEDQEDEDGDEDEEEKKEEL